MEQRSITFMWPRVFGLLDQVDVTIDDELVRGSRENRAVDKAGGAALFMIQCLVKLAMETDQTDIIPEHVNAIRGFPQITEREGICLWARHHRDYGAFVHAVQLVKLIVDGSTTAGEILDRLDVFSKDCLHQIMQMFLEDYEKKKKKKEEVKN